MSPQATLRVGKSERTRAAILNAALDFLWSRPFRDMTVHSLMASTGVSRSAFYQYFSDRHEVMETLLTMLQEEIFTVVEPWLGGVGDPVARIQETLGRQGVLLEQIKRLERAREERRINRAAAREHRREHRRELRSVRQDLRRDWRAWHQLCGVVLALQAA